MRFSNTLVYIFFIASAGVAQIEMHGAPQGSRRVKDDLNPDHRLPRKENEWGSFEEALAVESTEGARVKIWRECTKPSDWAPKGDVSRATKWTYIFRSPKDCLRIEVNFKENQVDKFQPTNCTAAPEVSGAFLKCLAAIKRSQR